VQFSSTNPAPSNSGIWTLDSLFSLPKTRLKYYLKLYNRLLKNTDNRLLVGAVETLNRLMDKVESRGSIKVGEKQSESTGAPTVDPEDEVVIDMRGHTVSPPAPEPAPLRPLDVETKDIEAKTGSETSSNHGSISGGYVVVIALSRHFLTCPQSAIFARVRSYFHESCFDADLCYAHLRP